uniref:Uncharacterized protein n=1 Tax=Marseillevirus sp. TaxID=2809551 RepID=A0AA96EPD3_9VIRU|nr:hypothetical protein MarDSR_250 [Marseillevirus sp.]
MFAIAKRNLRFKFAKSTEGKDDTRNSAGKE